MLTMERHHFLSYLHPHLRQEIRERIHVHIKTIEIKIAANKTCVTHLCRCGIYTVTIQQGSLAHLLHQYHT